MKISMKRLKEIIKEELSRTNQIDESDNSEELQEEEDGLESRRPGSRKSIKKLHSEEVK